LIHNVETTHQKATKTFFLVKNPKASSDLEIQDLGISSLKIYSVYIRKGFNVNQSFSLTTFQLFFKNLLSATGAQWDK